MNTWSAEGRPTPPRTAPRCVAGSTCLRTFKTHSTLYYDCTEAGEALEWKQAGRKKEEEVRRTERCESWRQMREEVSKRRNGRSLFSLQQVAFVRYLDEMKLISNA